MVRILRLNLLAFGAYFYFRIGFPDGGGDAYYLLAPIFLVGFACLCHFLLHMFEFSLGKAVWALEVLFTILVFGFFALTLPQSNGVPPYRQWISNGRPTHATASMGLLKLGVDPNTPAGRLVLALFP